MDRGKKTSLNIVVSLSSTSTTPVSWVFYYTVRKVIQISAIQYNMKCRGKHDTTWNIPRSWKVKIPSCCVGTHLSAIIYDQNMGHLSSRPIKYLHAVYPLCPIYIYMYIWIYIYIVFNSCLKLLRIFWKSPKIRL